MSTDVEPPSSPKLSFISHSHSQAPRKTTPHGPPPAAIDTQSDRRKHGRSASFGEFVSRMLPSRRQDKSHTLRAGIQEGSPHDAVDLVFGLVDGASASRMAAGETGDSSLERKVNSWSPYNAKGGGDVPATFGSVRSSGPRYSDEDTGEVSKRPRSVSIGWLLGVKSGVESSPEKMTESYPGPEEGGKGERAHLRKYSMPMALPQAHLNTSPKRVASNDTPPVAALDVGKTQQLFDHKKSHREQRRSLRDNGDFLGVQGANPRTGMWDLSDNTTSSGTFSQVSEDTRRNMEENARRVKESEAKYEEAKLKQQAEIKRIQLLKDIKRKEKAERKSAEGKAKQKRRGKWKASDNGWSSVAEPTLSPILQSVAGTPLKEIPSIDRLLPMPCPADPDPFWQDVCNEQKGYFPIRDGPSPPKVNQIEQPTGIKTPAPTLADVVIKRKPVGSPPGRRSANGSSETVVHSPSKHSETVSVVNDLLSSPCKKEKTTTTTELEIPGGFSSSGMRPRTPSPSYPFLDMERGRAAKRSPYERIATAISFQSVPTSQVRIHEPSPRSRLVKSQEGKVINSLSDLPPITLKDPIAARTPSRIPLSSQPQKIQPNIHAQVWAPQTIIRAKPDKSASPTNTSTITTTGSSHTRRPPSQLDGQDDCESNSQTQPALRHKTSRIPQRPNSLPNNKRDNKPSEKSPIHPVGTDTHSDRQLNQIKHRTERLCRAGSPGDKKVTQKSTHTSTSTFLRKTSKQKLVAQNAALHAVQNLQEGTGRERGTIRGVEATISPKARPQITEGVGGERTGTPSKMPTIDANNDRDMSVAGARTAELLHIKADAAVAVCHTRPDVGNIETGPIKERGVCLTSNTPSTARSNVLLKDVVASVLHTAWWIVGPVFDPASELRRRWATQRLTWRDMGTFTAAGVFAMAMFVLTVVCSRAIGMAFQVLKSFVGLFKLVTG